MNIRALVVGGFEVNCYVVSNDNGKALVIDPGADGDEIASLLERHHLSVAAYLITHGHMDHISALAELVSIQPAPVAIHPADEKWAFANSNQMLPYYGVPARPPSPIRHLADGQEWNDIGIGYRILATPGHTPGGVSFYFPQENALFTGDTLFAGSVGRTDFPGGDDRVLGESLVRLAGLPGQTAVYSGHGPQTTIRQEKATNPFLRYKTP